MSMPDSQRHLLNRNRVSLVRELIPNEEFFAVLMADHTLTPSMVEDIQSARTTQSKVGKLLDILPKRGAKAFQTFLDALRETHHDHLLEMLDPSGAASSQRSGAGVFSQPADTQKFARLNPSDTSSSRKMENPKLPQQTSVRPSDNPKQTSIRPSNNPQQTSVQPSDNSQQTSVQPSEEFERKPVQPVSLGVSVQISGQVLEEIVRVVGKILESKSSFIDLNSPDLKCVDGSEANSEQNVVMSNGQGAIIRLPSPATMSYDDINLGQAFNKFGFDVKNQSFEDLMTSLEKEETLAAIVFVFAAHSPDGAAADEISRMTQTFKNSAVLKGKPKVLIYQTTAAGVPSGDQMDSVRDDVTHKLSGLSLDGFDDNMAILKVSVTEAVQNRWLACSLVVLLMKYSKTMDLATMLRQVKDVLVSRSISVHLKSSLKEGLYFSAKS